MTSDDNSEAIGFTGMGGVPQSVIEWRDVEGVIWKVELREAAIVFCAADGAIELPEGAWDSDIYVSRHGKGFLVRIETFGRALRFLVTDAQARPVLDHISSRGAIEKDNSVAAGETSSAQALLWPKVSALAVWSLICSAFVFVPFLGLVPAVVTVILLVLHRVNVRRAEAWRHSRAICRVAFGMLAVGLCVSALAAWCLIHPADGAFSGPGFDTVVEGGEPTWGLVGGGLVVVLLALTVHEAAHAITAWWLGDGLAKSLGRVTLNPLAHIDPFGTILLPLILVWMGGMVFGYARPVPVRVDALPRHRRAHILISLAGPGSNLLLAAISFMTLLALGCMVRVLCEDAVVNDLSSFGFGPVTASGFVLAPVFAAACTVLKLSFFINVALAIFNLIPIPPLDGSWVLEHMFPRTLGPLYAWMRPYGFLIFIAAVYAKLFEYLIIPIAVVLLPGLALLDGATGM